MNIITKVIAQFVPKSNQTIETWRPLIRSTQEFETMSILKSLLNRPCTIGGVSIDRKNSHVKIDIEDDDISLFFFFPSGMLQDKSLLDIRSYGTAYDLMLFAHTIVVSYMGGIENYVVKNRATGKLGRIPVDYLKYLQRYNVVPITELEE